MIATLRANWQYVLLALVLAVFSWNLVSGRERVETRVEIPVETVNRPKDLVVSRGLVSRLEVRVRGPRGFIRSLDPSRLAYELDLGALTPGENVVLFKADKLPLSGALEVVDISPSRAILEVEPVAEKTLPVEAVWRGELKRDWKLIETVIEPAEVKVRGPKSLFASMTRVRTAPIILEAEVPETLTVTRGLDLPPGAEAVPAEVRVRLTFAPKTSEIWIKVPVEVPDELSRRVTVEPAEVRLLIEAPDSLITSGQLRGSVKASLLLDKKLETGSFDALYRLELPERTRLVQAKPSRVNVKVIPGNGG
jgi:hypothetical protein